jgi:hypothetical protein
MKAKEMIIITVVVVFGIIFWPAQAKAKLITIEIEAVVDYVEDDLGVLEGKINTGDIITGWYTYDTSTPDSNPLANYAAYWHYNPPAGISLTIGGLEFKTNPDDVNYRIAISNGYYFIDTFSLRSINNLPLSNGTLVEDIYWLLEDSTGTAVSTDALPTTPPILENWQYNLLLITGPYIGESFGIVAHVIKAVPEAFCGDPNHPYPVGDLNQDCRVDFLDLAILASHWMEDNSPRGAVTTTYKFLPDQSTMIWHVGRAGWSIPHSIEGQFQLTVDFDAGFARFEQVSAVLTNGQPPPSHPDVNLNGKSLGDLFLMCQLVGTIVSDTAVHFEGHFDFDESLERIVVVELSFRDSLVYLSGTK